MAYAYNAIDSLLAQQQGGQKQDIFGAGPAGQPGQAQQQGETGLKTSTEGADSGGLSAAPAQQQQQHAGVTDTGQSDRAAVAANAGKTAQAPAIQSVATQLQQKSDAQQAEANKYVTDTEAKQTYGVDNGNLEKAIGGDKTQFSAVQNLLGRKATDTFDPYKAMDTTVQDAGLLSTDAGLKDLISRGQGPQYTEGMGAFDLQSLRRSRGFNDQVQAMQAQQQQLNARALKDQTDKTQAVQDYGTKALTDAQANARGYLTGQASSINSDDAAQAAKANLLLGYERQGGGGINDAYTKALSDAKTQLAAQLGQNDPRSTQFIDPTAAGLAGNAMKYATVHGDYAGTDFTTAAEANRFNSIMGLLGQGDTRVAAQARGPDFTIDNTALQNALLSGVKGARTAKDTTDQTQVDQIMAQAKAAADADNARRAGLDVNKLSAFEANKLTGADFSDPAVAALFSKYGATPQQGYDPVAAAKYGTVDQTQLDAAHALTAAQADQLNALYGDLGSQTRAAAGTLGTGDAGFAFDKGTYIKALSDLLMREGAGAPGVPDDSAGKTAADVGTQQQIEAGRPKTPTSPSDNSGATKAVQGDGGSAGRHDNFDPNAPGGSTGFSPSGALTKLDKYLSGGQIGPAYKKAAGDIGNALTVGPNALAKTLSATAGGGNLGPAVAAASFRGGPPTPPKPPTLPSKPPMVGAAPKAVADAAQQKAAAADKARQDVFAQLMAQVQGAPAAAAAAVQQQAAAAAAAAQSGAQNVGGQVAAGAKNIGQVLSGKKKLW